MSRTKKAQVQAREARRKAKEDAVIANGPTSVAESPADTVLDGQDKKRKRKREEPEDDSKSSKKSKKAKKSLKPETIDTPIEDTQTPAELTDLNKKKKKSKKSKKSKRETAEVDDDNIATDVKAEESNKKATSDANLIPLEDEDEDEASAEAPRKSKQDKKKKQKKVKKKEKTAIESVPGADAEAESATKEPPEDPPAAEEDGEAEANAVEGSKGRFIVFVGNLPFSVTKEQLEKHFEKVSPTAVRLSTEKKTGKPRGFAFIEFDRFDRMETCLKKYQHSVFPDAKRKEGRKINIELTAGGGGNTEARKEKIQAKNVKLQDERQREREKRDELEAKQQQRKEKKEKKKQANTKVDSKPEANGGSGEPESGIHPARLAMLSRPPVLSDWQPTRKRF